MTLFPFLIDFSSPFLTIICNADSTTPSGKFKGLRLSIRLEIGA